MNCTLPGTIRGLLRKCSPVFVDCNGTTIKGVIIDHDNRPEDMRAGPWIVAPVTEWPDLPLEVENMPRSCKDDEMSLDLMDFTGRAHATLWLAKAMQADESCGSPRLELLGSMDRRKARIMCTMPEQVSPELLRRVCMHMAGFQEAEEK